MNNHCMSHWDPSCYDMLAVLFLSFPSDMSTIDRRIQATTTAISQPDGNHLARSPMAGEAAPPALGRSHATHASRTKTTGLASATRYSRLGGRAALSRPHLVRHGRPAAHSSCLGRRDSERDISKRGKDAFSPTHCKSNNNPWLLSHRRACVPRRARPGH